GRAGGDGSRSSGAGCRTDQALAAVARRGGGWNVRRGAPVTARAMMAAALLGGAWLATIASAQDQPDPKAEPAQKQPEATKPTESGGKPADGKPKPGEESADAAVEQYLEQH